VLRGVDQHLQATQRREREDTQDFGATLALVLGTASVTAVANGLAAWLARHSGARIQIAVDGSVIASNLNSRDASRIVEALRNRK
jgi:hypothetical protein